MTPTEQQDFVTAEEEAMVAARVASVRKHRGLLLKDLFCKNCHDYRSEHTPEGYCVFHPTKYVELSAQAWRALKVSALCARVEQGDMGTAARDLYLSLEDGG